MIANHLQLLELHLNLILEALVFTAIRVQKDRITRDILSDFSSQRQVFKRLNLTRLLSFDTRLIGPLGSGFSKHKVNIFIIELDAKMSCPRSQGNIFCDSLSRVTLNLLSKSNIVKTLRCKIRCPVHLVLLKETIKLPKHLLH